MNDANQESKGLNRRDFLRAGAAGATGIALTGVGALKARAADGEIGQLPRRPLWADRPADQRVGGGGGLESGGNSAGGEGGGELLAQGASLER